MACQGGTQNSQRRAKRGGALAPPITLVRFPADGKIHRGPITLCSANAGYPASRLMMVKLGKGWLVSRLQALLQTHRLHLPDTQEAKTLAQELLDYEIKVDENANDK